LEVHYSFKELDHPPWNMDWGWAQVNISCKDSVGKEATNCYRTLYSECSSVAGLELDKCTQKLCCYMTWHTHTHNLLLSYSVDRAWKISV